MHNATDLIQRQLDAYNTKDIDAWLGTYAKDARQFHLHGDCFAEGHAQLRERMLSRFQEPDLHARLLNRLVMGNLVVDKELIIRNLPEGKAEVEMLCIYEIRDGLIQTASFAMTEPRLIGG
ncbi:nuclear transport factor 2 family protein [Rheinheimera marina]|uniref:Nuclear transport factor 2 family protein n=1 Tax=Rheinheimera marina TaxID=1774958 RepID=A0ABV9JJQ2_9GAMM